MILENFVTGGSLVSEQAKVHDTDPPHVQPAPADGANGT